MALPAPELDDRKFQDIVDEAKRLIPRYCPEWTNHNVSDPGVALIELFAWMSEMILFRINQVPDRLYTKFLDLVGIRPFPPSVARVDLTFWLSAVLDSEVVVPAGTEVTTAHGAATGEGVVFSTVEDLSIRPPQLFAAKTGVAGESTYLDVWDDLRFEGSEVVCFSSSPLQVGDAWYLGFRDSIAGALLRLALFARAEGIGVRPPDPPVVWEVWSGVDWVRASVELDTTGGLNRNGQIVMRIPRRMDQLLLAGTAAYWIRCRLVEAREGQANYQVSPRIESVSADVLGGTVGAEHASSRPRESLGRSVGVSGQTFGLANVPVLPCLEGEVVQVIVGQQVQSWTEVADFSASGRDDRHYTLDGASGVVSFGPAVRYPDGGVRQHGAIPPDGAEIVITGYRQGGGAAGNVGEGTLTVLRHMVANIDRVANLTAAEHGADGETVANAKVRGPLSLRTGERAVTTSDFERLTLESSSEVARVRCLRPTDPAGAVRLLVVPRASRPPTQHTLDDFQLSDDLVSRMVEYLEPRRILGTTVEIDQPRYQGVMVAALLNPKPGRPAEGVAQRANDMLYRYINPLTGGNTGEGWPFGADVNVARLTELLEAVDGVERVEEIVLFECDLATRRPYGPGRDTIRLGTDSLFLSSDHQVLVR